MSPGANGNQDTSNLLALHNVDKDDTPRYAHKGQPVACADSQEAIQNVASGRHSETCSATSSKPKGHA